MANYCRNCGNPLNEIDKFCGKCGTPVLIEQQVQGQTVQVPAQPVVQQEQGISKEDNDKANLYTLISLALNIIVAPLLSSFTAAFSKVEDGLASSGLSLVSLLGGICELAGLGLLIFVRVKYPKNVFSKVVLIVYLVLFIMSLIAMVVVIFACMEAVKGCPG